MLKVALVGLLVATLVSLFAGLFFLVKDQGRTARVVNALTLRVTLAALIVLLLVYGFFSGQLGPHST